MKTLKGYKNRRSSHRHHFAGDWVYSLLAVDLEKIT